MKIRGIFYNLEMCGIYEWTYQIDCRALQTGHPWKESEYQCFSESLEAHNGVIMKIGLVIFLFLFYPTLVRLIRIHIRASCVCASG
jgi:hypothetical protein